MISDMTRIAVFRALSVKDSHDELIGEEVVECTIDVVGIKTSNITAEGSKVDVGEADVVPLDKAVVQVRYGSRKGHPQSGGYAGFCHRPSGRR